MNHLAEKERADYFICVVAVCVLCFFFAESWTGLQSVIVTFPGHTKLFWFVSFFIVFTEKDGFRSCINIYSRIIQNNLLFCEKRIIYVVSPHARI